MQINVIDEGEGRYRLEFELDGALYKVSSVCACTCYMHMCTFICAMYRCVEMNIYGNLSVMGHCTV